jgi:RimJ/RimL family protein N-acetyltransferase
VLPKDGRITETCRSQLIFHCFRHFKLKKLTLSAFVGNKQSIWALHYMSHVTDLNLRNYVLNYNKKKVTE